MLVIVDAKRGDVGTTNDAYAEAYYLRVPSSRKGFWPPMTRGARLTMERRR